MTTVSAPLGLPPHDVVDVGLADEGVRRIEWSEREMPVLRLIRQRFAAERPLAGLRIGACLHVTTETANLMRTLQAGGASVSLCASNPLSTKDDVGAALVARYGISTFARRGEDRDTYYRHLNAVADTHPQITMDDGCDLVSLLHSDRPDQVGEVLAGTMAGRTSARDITLFKSLGMAVEDVATAHYVYTRARERGVGQEIDFH